MKEHAFSVFYPHLVAAMEQTGKSWEEVAAFVRTLDIHAVDIGLKDLTQKGVAENLKQAGFEITSVYVSCEFQDDPENLIELDVINAAKKYGFNQVLVVPGMLSDENPDALNNILIGLQSFCKTCFEHNLTVVLEDYDFAEAPFGTSSQMLYFFNKVPGLKACLDTGNFEYFGEDLQDAYERLRGRIVHVHCKDRTLVRPDAVYGSHAVDGRILYPAAVGEGFLPIESIVKQLIADGYKGMFSIEHFGSPDMLGDIQKSVRNLKKWIHNR